jgi:hypothetical protein
MKAQLLKLRLRAMRSGIWYTALSRIDRVLVDLTIKVVKDIRSSQLAKSISVVMGKLDELLEGRFLRLKRTIGYSMAEKISVLAQEWGNTTAHDWATDRSFASYLLVMHANK